jgi:rhodanese-related sulfurtransferase
MTVQTITPEELGELLVMDERVDLIDVRTPAEYESAHVQVARNVPLDALDPDDLIKHRKSPGDAPIYVLCPSGEPGAACEKLQEAGMVGVCVEGGTPACERAGIAVKRGRRVLSLERQVRIVAGTLILIGTALSALVSPWFLIVPGFVGCGCIVAGVTNFCGMELILAKMPWNRADGASHVCAVKPVMSR